MKTTEELRALAERTRDEALLRERERFQSQYGRFYKCSNCGARGTFAFGHAWRGDCTCEPPNYIETGYSWTTKP